MAKKAKKTTKSDVESRLAALEAQVELLTKAAAASAEQAVANQSGTAKRKSKPDRHWAFEPLKNLSDEGGVTFAGYVILPTEETYAWQIESKLADALAADWSVAQTPLAALAHPMRLAILKALLHGKRDTQSLQTLPEMGTSGQLYHHLKELESAGWIRQPRRGEYNLLAERVVPLLAILVACEITDKK